MNQVLSPIVFFPWKKAFRIVYPLLTRALSDDIFLTYQGDRLYALFTVWFLNFSVSGLLQSGLETSSWRSPWVTGLKVKPSCSGGFDLLTLPVLGDTLLFCPNLK